VKQVMGIALATALLASSPAKADVTAVYQAKGHAVTMTVEIADGGSVRYQMSVGSTYGLVIDAIDYFVQPGPNGPIVQRVSDLMTAQKEQMAAFLPKDMVPDDFVGPKLVPMGKVTINGREGRAYTYESQQVAKSPIPVVVVSDDPRLAQLGRVMANQFAKSSAMMDGVFGRTPGMITEMEKILNSGAAISFAGMELVSTNEAKIDGTRFNLPAPPETLDQIRARLKPPPPPPTAMPEQR